MEEKAAMMDAWQVDRKAEEKLKKVRIPIPEIKDDEILVKVAALSLNYRDKALIEGKLHIDKESLVPVGDFSGKVIKKGAQVTRFELGDRVLSHLFSKWIEGSVTAADYSFQLGSHLDGGLAQYAVLNQNGAVLIPDFYSDEEAATFPTAGLTAWYALVSYGNLQADENILVQGTGGVSVFAMQIAQIFGANAIVTTSSEEKGEKALQFGASRFINYNTGSWDTAVLSITGGQGVDKAVEVIGGESLARTLNVVKHNGQVAVIGFLESNISTVDVLKIMDRQIRIQGIAVGSRTALETMIGTFSERQVRPVIDTVYAFDDSPKAFEHLEKGSIGKIVIKAH